MQGGSKNFPLERLLVRISTVQCDTIVVRQLVPHSERMRVDYWWSRKAIKTSPLLLLHIIQCDCVLMPLLDDESAVVRSEFQDLRTKPCIQRRHPISKADRIWQAPKKVDVLLSHERFYSIDRVLCGRRGVVVYAPRFETRDF
jgi:hypothetical protein